MKAYLGVLGAGVLLASAGLSHAAAVTVTSKLALNLTLSVTTDLSATSGDSNAKITKIRFTTKDLIAFADAGASGNAIKSAAIQRLTTLADGAPANELYLSQPIVFLDSAGATVTTTGILSQTALDLTAASSATSFTSASAIKDDATKGEVTRKDLLLKATKWVLDADGTSPTTDQIAFDLIGLVTANSKRHFTAGVDNGLFLTGWSAPVSGGVHIDSLQLGTTADTDGVVTGTITVGPEKV